MLLAAQFDHLNFVVQDREIVVDLGNKVRDPSSRPFFVSFRFVSIFALVYLRILQILTCGCAGLECAVP